MVFLFLGLLLLMTLLLLGRTFVNANPARVRRFLVWFGLSLGAIAAVVVLALFLVSDRLAPALSEIATIVLLLFRSRKLWRRGWNAAGPAAGGASEIETEFLRMQLDHDSGTMSGTVRRGSFRGQRLDELSRTELLALWRECRAEDESSTNVLEAYLDRFMPDWREAAAGRARGDTEGTEEDETGQGSRSTGTLMTPQEAYAVLGLAPGADAATIKEAHRRLMKKLHPDQGGSNYLAAKINRAKEVLLKGV